MAYKYIREKWKLFWRKESTKLTFTNKAQLGGYRHQNPETEKRTSIVYG